MNNKVSTIRLSINATFENRDAYVFVEKKCEEFKRNLIKDVETFGFGPRDVINAEISTAKTAE